MMINKKNNEPKRKAPSILKYSGMAAQMLGTILAFTYLGYRIDEWQKNHVPVWTLVLSLLSIGGSLYGLIKGITKINKDS